MEKRIEDILTEDEHKKIRKLKRKIVNASSKMELRDARQEFLELVDNAKERYYD